MFNFLSFLFICISFLLILIPEIVMMYLGVSFIYFNFDIEQSMKNIFFNMIYDSRKKERKMLNLFIIKIILANKEIIFDA